MMLKSTLHSYSLGKPDFCWVEIFKHCQPKSKYKSLKAVWTWMWQSSTSLPWRIHLPKFLLLLQTPNLLTLEPAQFLCSSFDNSCTGLDILLGMFSRFFCHGFGCLPLLPWVFLPYIHYDMDHNF